MKDSISSQWTTGVIKVIFTTDSKKVSYCSAEIQDGNMDLLFLKSSYYSNVDQLGSKLLETLKSNSGMSLKAELNIQKTEAERVKLLAEIQDLVGIPVPATLDVDWNDIARVGDQRGYHDRAGEILNTLLTSLRDNLTEHVKESLVKDSLVAVWSTGVISHKMVSDKVQSYCGVAFVDGVLEMQSNESAFYSNVANMGDARMLEKLEAVGAAATSLPLKSAINEEKYRPSMAKYCEEIADAVGIQCILDVDLVQFDAAAEKAGYGGRVGEVVYEFILGSFKNSILKLISEDTGTCKRMLTQYWLSGVILVLLDDQLDRMNASFFDNGDIVVALKPDSICSNVETIGSDLVFLMVDTENSNLTVTASIALQKARPELDALLERLRQAVQLPSEIVVDLDFAALAAAVDALDRLDQVAQVWQWILEGLVANVESVCSDDLVQGAILEAWATGTLRLILDDSMNGWSCDFVDGELVITVNSAYVASNVTEIGKDIVDKL